MGQIRQTGRFLRRWWPVVVAAGLMIAVAGFVGLLALINLSAHHYAQAAQREYGGGEIAALLRAVGDERRPLTERNHAVWALAQFRDPRALPVLQRYYTGGECRHDRFLCQRELKRAIDWCSGRSDAPRWLRRAVGWTYPREPAPPPRPG
jgi:hypothetical protein